MKILVINSGSSSLKFDVFELGEGREESLVKGLVEGIGEETPKIRLKSAKGKQDPTAIAAVDHKEALGAAMEAIRRTLTPDGEAFVPDAIGHRVVHGGSQCASALVDDALLKILDGYCALAPLHNPPNLTGIRACLELFPGVPNTAVFDTAFHATMPDYARLYGLPLELTERLGIYRYGFHGTSHRYVSSEFARFAGRPLESLKLVTLHLGNGSSLAAVSGGRSVDTTMGFTPLEGLMMGTRTGDIDAGVVLYLLEHEGMNVSEVNKLLNKKSGVLGLSGMSNDMRIVEDAMMAGNARAKLAFDVFCHRIRRAVGALAASMNGADALVFTAGIGENSDLARQAVCDGLGVLGVKLDAELNAGRIGVNKILSTPDSRCTVAVIPTNEELMIARDTKGLVG